MSLRTSREGFEGFGLQAEPRPAACRRIPRSPPVKSKRPLKLAGVLFLGGASDVPADIARGGRYLFDERHSGILRSISIKCEHFFAASRGGRSLNQAVGKVGFTSFKNLQGAKHLIGAVNNELPGS